jgi:hypothetical protein
MPELERTVGKRVPIFLVATHTDLKEDKYVKKCTNIVSTSEGQQLADDINAAGYFETACTTADSLSASEIFESAIAAVSGRKSCIQTLKSIIGK